MQRTTPWLLLLALSAHSPARALAQTDTQAGSPPPQVPLVLDDAWRSSIELKVRTDGAEQALAEVRDTTQWLREQLAAQSSRGAGDVLDEGLLGALATSVEMELRILVHQGRLAEAQALCATYFKPDPAAAPKGDPRLSTFVTLALRKSDAYRKLVVAAPGTPMTDLPLAAPTAAQDRTRAIVADSIQAGDTDLLLRLGASAADAYEQLALNATQPAELLLSSPGPLAWLASVDPTRAVRVASALVRRTGSGWKAAIATELTSRGPRTNPLTLNAEVMRQPATLALVAELAEGDELNAEHVESITLGLASAAVEGPVMARYLARALPVLEQRDKLGQWPFVPLTQHMLRSSDPSERASAAQALARHDNLRLEDAARLAQDPVADVRSAVAAALPRVTPGNKDLSEEERAPWRALVRDASTAVRRALYVSILDYLNLGGQSPFTVADSGALRAAQHSARCGAQRRVRPDLSRAVSWLDRARARPATARERRSPAAIAVAAGARGRVHDAAPVQVAARRAR
ncbi:MAG: hypothetical protein R3F49_24540 [Planctomycetota bacterium]